MPKSVLKKYFGYEEFREGQSSLIAEILQGNDVLGIMPTGAGKSICFQVPAIMSEGITIVVSPLISLMQDQVKSLIQAGISSAYINSSLTNKQIDKALNYALEGKYKVIYVAPERLFSDNFLYFAQNSNISMLTVDEAHCISQWGQDFRPSYAQIPEFIEQLEKRPVVSAFTATATEQVKIDIINILKLRQPLVLVSGFDRENLYFEVKNSKNKMEDLLDFLRDKKDQSGIIYCTTRKNVEKVCEELAELSFSVKRYHAGISQEERQQNQRDFIFDDVKIMVATNAFGMGIDKSNVNFVVHYNMPKDMESYYQEAGRAGRDGSSAHCLMLYSAQDVATNQFLIENSKDMNYESAEMEQILKERDYKRLQEINLYSTTNECLRQYILQYFGESPPIFCGNCGNCDAEFEVFDATVEAQKIISCVIRVNERFGKGMIADILKGSKNAKILQLGFDKLSTYGISEVSSVRIRLIIDNLIATGYLHQTNSQYSVLETTEKSADILKKGEKFEIKIAIESEEHEIRKKKTKEKGVPPERQGLFEELRRLRSEFATEQSVPAFVVFGDFSLIDMCAKLPTDLQQFSKISGVGQAKLEKYGEKFVKTILDYCNEQNINVDYVKITRKSTSRTGELILPSDEMIGEVELTDELQTVSEINNIINAMLEFYECSKTTAVKINGWLEQEGYLTTTKTERGNTKTPTEKGFENGITQIDKEGKDYSYKLNMFPKQIQELIVANTIEILQFKK